MKARNRVVAFIHTTIKNTIIIQNLPLILRLQSYFLRFLPWKLWKIDAKNQKVFKKIFGVFFVCEIIFYIFANT